MKVESIPIVEFLRAHKGSIIILPHENPDGDAFGSALALYLFLKKVGKEVYIGCKDKVPHFLDFLPYIEEVIKIPNGKVYDVGIIVDSADFNRIGTQIKVIKKIRIDHHLGGEYYSIYDYIDTSAPSTTAIVYEIIANWDESAIDKDIATCIYTGLATDTGFFKYTNTTEYAFDLAKKLVHYGADPNFVYRMFSERESVNKMKLIAKALETLTLYEDGLVAGITLFDKFFKETNTEYTDSEGLVNFPRFIEGVEVAFAIIEKPEEEVWKVSLRSKTKANVARIASVLGGGGHKYASGCKIKANSYEEALEKLLKAIKEELKHIYVNA